MQKTLKLHSFSVGGLKLHSFSAGGLKLHSSSVGGLKLHSFSVGGFRTKFNARSEKALLILKMLFLMPN